MLYDFKRADGTWIVRDFPMGACPSEITDDDGVKARRGWRPESLPAITWKEGQGPSEYLQKQNARRTRDNLAAGDRGREEWRAKSPKLVTG